MCSLYSSHPCCDYKMALILLCVTHLSVSLPISSRKLELLSNQGYEVVSAASDFLTPVGYVDNQLLPLAELDQSSGNLASSNRFGLSSSSDMFLYGTYLLLRKKTPYEFRRNSWKTTFSRNYNRPGAGSSYSGRELVQRRGGPRIDYSGNTWKQRNQQPGSSGNHPIFFPETTTQKYIRVKDNSGISTTRRENSAATTTTVISSIPTVSTTQTPNMSSSPNNTSERFIAWARNNLNSTQLTKLLQLNLSSISEDSTEEFIPNSKLDIGYYSFIDVPVSSPKCPEGQRLNHRGKCTPKYVHKSSSPLDELNTSSKYLRFIRLQMQNQEVRDRLTRILNELKKVEKDLVTEIKQESMDIVKNRDQTTLLRPVLRTVETQR